MRVGGGGVNQVIGTGIMIEIVIRIGIGTGNVTKTVQGLVSGAAEVVVMEGGMATVTAADHVHQLGMVAGGHLGVQFDHISGIV